MENHNFLVEEQEKVSPEDVAHMAGILNSKYPKTSKHHPVYDNLVFTVIHYMPDGVLPGRNRAEVVSRAELVANVMVALQRRLPMEGTSNPNRQNRVSKDYLASVHTFLSSEEGRAWMERTIAVDCPNPNPQMQERSDRSHLYPTSDQNGVSIIPNASCNETKMTPMPTVAVADRSSHLVPSAPRNYDTMANYEERIHTEGRSRETSNKNLLYRVLGFLAMCCIGGVLSVILL
ncbi:hypothetical protein GQ44DRAFT_715631 [Phaeosphaeriaceae sp. PMI808]|nr:hypothetical protein GQ44DRAFT_715631 [Phaeosphaeriaceae sp. PMI808]